MKKERLLICAIAFMAIGAFCFAGISTRANYHADESGRSVGGVIPQHVVDLNGDGKTDYVLTRNTGGGPNGQILWMGVQNGGTAQTFIPWGLASDIEVPEDYNGDGKTDIAVWRPGGSGAAAWFILQSQTSTVRAEPYGQLGDDPTVVGDYDGDNKADLAVFRAAMTFNGPTFWYYRTTPGGPVFARRWGISGDIPVPGDFDGDGKHDFVIRRAELFQGVFYFNYSTFAPGFTSRVVSFGGPTDQIVKGDFDGDGKTDITVLRSEAGNFLWAYEPSTNLGTYLAVRWGVFGGDTPTPGDYDGDGKTDPAVFSSSLNPGNNYFYVRKSSDGGILAQRWGNFNDYAVANFNVR